MPMGEVIRRKRKELGLTQEQVAQRLGISAPAVNKWERGSSYPDITILPALARLLNTDINTLLCFQEELTDVLNDLSIVLSMLMNIAFEEGDVKRAEKIASAGEQTALLYDQWGYSPLLLPMDLALKRKDVEKSIAYIREILRMLTEPQHMSESAFYCHIYGKENFGRKFDKAMETYAERILPGLLAEMKTGKDYAFLQGE